MSYDLTYMAFGGGVDSTGLLIAANLGLWNIPPIACAIYVDCGADHPQTLIHVHKMKAWSKIPVHILPATPSLFDDLLNPNGFIGIPAYVAPRGMLFRACSRLYKIRFTLKFLREQLGYLPHKHIRAKVLSVQGIGAHEAKRAHLSPIPWIDNAYPMITADIDREACLKICDIVNIPRPHRSACICCPLHGNAEWKELKGNGNTPEWKKLVEIDNSIRHRLFPKLKRELFLHWSYKPLEDVTFPT